MEKSTQITLKRFIELRKEFYIIFSWLIGLVIGLHIFYVCMMPSVFEIKTASTPYYRFLSSVISFCSTICISYFLITKRCGRHLSLICFLKALLYGFSLSAIHMRFRSGAWLGRCLFLFAESFEVCILLWFWLRHARRNNHDLHRDVALSAALLICIYFLDACFFTPFHLLIT